jgi:hypothetical protein
MSAKRNRKFSFAYAALEKVCFISARNRPKGDSIFITNPTTGALEVAPEHRDKVAKALTHEARCIVYRLYLAKARTYPEFLWLKAKLMLLEFINKLSGNLSKSLFR